MPKIPGITPLLFLISAIMVAAAILASYSYRSVDQLAARTEESVATSNRVLGLKLIDRIESKVIDNDLTFFTLVNLDDPREFMELWRRIIRVSPAVESVAILDDQREVQRFVAKLAPAERRWFRKVLVTHLVPDMALAKLPRDTHKHLHVRYRGRTYLLSYIRRHSEGRDYFIVLSMNVQYLLREFFVQELKHVAKGRSIAVIDEDGAVLHGSPVATAESKLVFEDRFPTTLYKWRLQIAPKDIGALRKETETRSLLHFAIVGVAAAVILLGMFAVVVAMVKQRRVNELKSEFIANVSHEFKTPLSLIRMFGELLALGRAGTDRTQEYAEIITRESDRLTALIDNVLDFARIERGKAAYEFSRGDLAPVVSRAVELLRYRCEQAGVDLQTEIPETLPEVSFDHSAMTLLLLNLVENALKYGAQNGGEIRVALRREGLRLVLIVADEGPGIPHEEQRKVFDRFYRGESAGRTGSRGSGIGLSLVKHIAEAHGGSVKLQSELGKGAVFEVSIPIG